MKRSIVGLTLLPMVLFFGCGGGSTTSANFPYAGTWLVTSYQTAAGVNVPVPQGAPAMTAVYSSAGDWTWSFPPNFQIFGGSGAPITAACSFGGSSVVNGNLFTGTLTFNSCPVGSNLGGAVGGVTTEYFIFSSATLTLVLNDGPIKGDSIILTRQ